jgi:hypothetical protein
MQSDASPVVVSRTTTYWSTFLAFAPKEGEASCRAEQGTPLGRPGLHRPR